MRYTVAIGVILLQQKLPLFTKNTGYCKNLTQILKCKIRFYSVGELCFLHYLFLKPITDLSLKAIYRRKYWKFPNVKKHQTIFVFTSFLLPLTCCKSEASEALLGSS